METVKIPLLRFTSFIVIIVSFSSANPSWAQHGNARVVFQSDRDGDEEIYTMNTDGTNLVQLTHNSASDGAPQWSPDGRQILFSTDRDGNLEIYLMDADGSRQINLTENPKADCSPRWSPDGKFLTFMSNRDSNHRSCHADIYIMNVSASNGFLTLMG
jgi:TolB protein